MRSCKDNFKIPIAFTSKEKESVVSKVFHDLSRPISEDKMLSSKGRSVPVFVTEYTRRKEGDSARKGETVVVRKLLGSLLDFIDAFAKEAWSFRDSPF